jgi:hypothetical protein
VSQHTCVSSARPAAAGAAGVRALAAISVSWRTFGSNKWRSADGPATFTDLEQDAKDSIETIKNNPFVPRTDNVRGFVYEVETGRPREVS